MANSLEFLSSARPIRMHAQELDLGAGQRNVRRPALLLLHGSGGHVDSWAARLGPFLHEAGISLYAPHYFDRTGTVRADLALLTDGVHVPQWIETVDAALRFVASRPGVDPEQIVVAGISLGAFLALALAAQLSTGKDPLQGRRMRALLDVSGGLVPPYDAMATERMPPTLILHGAADTIVSVSYALELDRRLTDLEVPHRTEILEGEGHWFSGNALPRILLAVSAFLQENLKLESVSAR